MLMLLYANAANMSNVVLMSCQDTALYLPLSFFAVTLL